MLSKMKNGLVQFKIQKAITPLPPSLYCCTKGLSSNDVTYIGERGGKSEKSNEGHSGINRHSSKSDGGGGASAWFKYKVTSFLDGLQTHTEQHFSP